MNVLRIVLVVVLVSLCTTLAHALPAFPGAEGFGANATGGRGGDVYYVTNLNDDGPGSLRYGVDSATNSRTILFKVSGNIRLKSQLKLEKPRLTIAGQTAPGDGICLQDYTIVLNANDLVVRHIRSRLGTSGHQQADGMTILGGTNIIVDHCSASWSVDEALSPVGQTANLTVQWTYITEALNESIHVKGPHGYGSLIRPRVDASFTFHHDLYANNNSRNPRAGTYGSNVLRLDFRNNVIYNWGIKAGYNYYTFENLELNYVNNYLIRGPATTCFSCAFEAVATNTLIFQSDNRFDINLNGRLDGTNTGWRMFVGDHKKRTEPHAAPPVTTDSAEVAYERVLAQAGALPWRRDPVDARIAGNVRDETGRIIDSVDQVGGWPELRSEEPPADSDNDGMPDYWEAALGLNPKAADDDNDRDKDGYTNLEEYLNWLGDMHAVAIRNTPVEINLQSLCGNSKNLTFTASDVTLLKDGHTARFTPKKDFAGLASFKFTAMDSATGISFGPVTVGVLVSPSR